MSEQLQEPSKNCQSETDDGDFVLVDREGVSASQNNDEAPEPPPNEDQEDLTQPDGPSSSTNPTTETSQTPPPSSQANTPAGDSAEEGQGEKTAKSPKLKGVWWPGMDISDFAYPLRSLDPDMGKKLNERSFGVMDVEQDSDGEDDDSGSEDLEPLGDWRRRRRGVKSGDDGESEAMGESRNQQGRDGERETVEEEAADVEPEAVERDKDGERADDEGENSVNIARNVQGAAGGCAC